MHASKQAGIHACGHTDRQADRLVGKQASKQASKITSKHPGRQAGRHDLKYFMRVYYTLVYFMLLSLFFQNYMKFCCVFRHQRCECSFFFIYKSDPIEEIHFANQFATSRERIIFSVFCRMSLFRKLWFQIDLGRLRVQRATHCRNASPIFRAEPPTAPNIWKCVCFSMQKSVFFYIKLGSHSKNKYLISGCLDVMRFYAYIYTLCISSKLLWR